MIESETLPYEIPPIFCQPNPRRGDFFMYPQRKYNRISGCNYSSDGAYFVTICTMNRKHLFGKIANGAMYLNNFGKIARQYWDEIPNHFDRVIIDEYCIMPNHLHGIIIVGHNDRCADNGNSQRNNHLQRNNHGCSLRNKVKPDIHKISQKISYNICIHRNNILYYK